MGTWKREKIGEIKEPILDYIRGLVEAEKSKGNHIRVVLGTDSQRRGKGINFSTVILLEIKSLFEDKNDIIEVGRGAMAIYKNEFIKRDYSLNEKMIREVQMTVELAYELLPLIEELKCELELHADINSDPTKGKSHSSLNVAMGWLSGPGCRWKIKPDAYCASHTADKYCR